MSTHLTYKNNLIRLADQLDEPTYELIMEMHNEIDTIRAKIEQLSSSGKPRNKDFTIEDKPELKYSAPNQPAKTHPKWMNSAEVQSYLGISKRTLQNYRDQGVIAFSKLRGKMYYSRKNVETLVRPQCQASNKTETKTANKQ